MCWYKYITNQDVNCSSSRSRHLKEVVVDSFQYYNSSINISLHREDLLSRRNLDIPTVQRTLSHNRTSGENAWSILTSDFSSINILLLGINVDSFPHQHLSATTRKNSQQNRIEIHSLLKNRSVLLFEIFTNVPFFFTG